jgi:hypothetical protein
MSFSVYRVKGNRPPVFAFGDADGPGPSLRSRVVWKWENDGFQPIAIEGDAVITDIPKELQSDEDDFMIFDKGSKRGLLVGLCSRLRAVGISYGYIWYFCGREFYVREATTGKEVYTAGHEDLGWWMQTTYGYMNEQVNSSVTEVYVGMNGLIHFVFENVSSDHILILHPMSVPAIETQLTALLAKERRETKALLDGIRAIGSQCNKLAGSVDLLAGE